MADKIITFEENGENPEPKLNMKNLIQKARDDWSIGKKNEAFQTAMSGMVLVSKGVAKLMHDTNALKLQIEELQRRVTPK